MDEFCSKFLILTKIFVVIIITFLFLFNPKKTLAASLVWNTFYAKTAGAMSLDSDGNIYVAGYSTDTWGTPINPYTSGNEAFVAKFDLNGILLWNTFLGGSGSDNIDAIFFENNSIYVSGKSTVTWGTPVRNYTLGDDAFIAKLDSNGILLWNTFLGGSGSDNSSNIVSDTNGNIYVAGSSNATWGSPVRTYASNYDVFVAKLNSSGSLIWNTFLGGSGSDMNGKLVIDSDGNLYMSNWYSDATWGTPIRAFSLNKDVSVSKLDNNGVLLWNTFLGTTGDDYGYTVDLDVNNNIVLTGYSNVTWGTPIRAFTSATDAFVAKLDNDGALLWNTFLGGSGTDQGNSLKYKDNSIFVTGLSTVSWGTPINAFSTYDAYVAKLDNDGTLLWNTFLGRSGSFVFVSALDVDSNNYVIITGVSTGTLGSPIVAHSVNNNTFLAKFEGFPSVSSVTSSVGDSGTEISWTSDVVSSSQVEYGTTTSYGSSTSEYDTSSRVTSHSVTLTGLNSCTQYHYRVKGKDAGETQGVSGDYSFTSQGCTGSPNTSEVYQITQEVQNMTTTNQILTPTKDSNAGEQNVVVIIQPQTFSFNAFLSSVVNNTLLGTSTFLKTTTGTFRRISPVQEIWYKAYAPVGYSPAKIMPFLQLKPSILSLSYTGNYTNLQIAYSIDGKVWRILPNSVIDTKNKTVAVIGKIGGYYTLVKPNNYSSQTTVLGTTTQQQESPSPVSSQRPKVADTETIEVNPIKQTIFSWIIQNLGQIFKRD